MNRSTTAVLVVAAGRGTRLGADLPKQYLPLCGVPVLRRTVERFLVMPEIARLHIVIHPDDRDRYDETTAGITDLRLGQPIGGGETRAASVRAGLEALASDPPDTVLIHDAARPFVTTHAIQDVISALDESEGAALALPVVDALWSARDGNADRPVDRTALWRAQTPQGFHFDRIIAAHRANSGDAADDIAVARAAGIEVRLIAGSEANYKITTAADLARAERELIKT